MKFFFTLLLILSNVSIIFSQTHTPQVYPMKSIWINHANTWGEINSEGEANNLACRLFKTRRNAVFMYVSDEDISEPDYVNKMQRVISYFHYYNISVYAFYLESSNGHFSNNVFETDPELDTEYIASRDAFINYMNSTQRKLHRFDGLVIAVEPWAQNSAWSNNWSNGAGSNNIFLQNHYLNYVSNFRNTIQPYINDSNWGNNFQYGGVVQSIWHKRSRMYSSFPNGSYVYLTTEDADGNGKPDYFDFVIPEAYCYGGKGGIFLNVDALGDLEWITLKDIDPSKKSQYWHAIDNGAKVVIGIGIGDKGSISYCLQPDYHDDVWDFPNNWNPNAITTDDGYEHFINYKLSPQYPGGQCVSGSALGTSVFPGRNLIDLDLDPNKHLLERICFKPKNANAKIKFGDDLDDVNKISLISIINNEIIIDDIVESIKVYNMRGQLIEETTNASYISLQGKHQGVLIIQLMDEGKNIYEIHKLLIN